ncbi:Putative Importin subunit alpha [Rhizopus microsporus]|nr:Putative Importin subunit alpha [Rhizopus microsporus]
MYYKTPVLLIEFDENKSFSLQGVSDLRESIRLQDISSKLVVLTLAFPKLRIIWSPSPHETATIFEDLKSNQEEPNMEKAASIGAEEGEDGETVYNMTPQDILRSMPGVNSKNYKAIISKVVINCGALPALLSLLSSHKEAIRKEACWTISNITAGNIAQIDAVIEANIIPALVQILQTADFKTKKEACWAIVNATSGGLNKPSQIHYLVSQGVIKPLCDMLMTTENKMIQVALDGLENILKIGEQERPNDPEGINRYAAFIEECGGMDIIHQLQQHENNEIYKKAFDIIDRYFAQENEEQMAEETVPQSFTFHQNVPQGGFNFGP